MEKVLFTNKENLKWARKRSGFDFSYIYKKTGWKPEKRKIQKWEEGSDFPTISELRKLGEVYRCAWTLFILKKNAKDLGFKPLEFRKIFGTDQIAPSPFLLEFLNDLKSKQNFLIEFADTLGLRNNRLVGLCKDLDNREAVAKKIIQHTEIDMDVFWKKRTRLDGFNYLVECLERKNIFVSLTNSHAGKVIPVEQMRGVLLNSNIAPIIGINTKNESYGARIFTVFHELTHLFRGDSFRGDAEVAKINFRKHFGDKNDKESFCDSVAARILVPDSQLKKISDPIEKDLIERECVRLKVNHQPLLYRMQDFGLLSQKEVGELLKKLREDKVELSNVQGDKKGGPDGGFLKMLQNGRAFVHAVNELYFQGFVTFTQALNVLNVKAKTYRKFAEKV
ncbi:MAG: ImmA/IrrE family metallo-endopeptidase [Candidatus Kaiserbacteria bacterium]|nr:ImmA/IrrE family metallo-endopeptidase [Candidatus Kaiserbacteria bacterium]